MNPPPYYLRLLPWFSGPFLVGLCAWLFFLGLADRDLWSSHEGRAAQDAQTLVDDGLTTFPRLFDGRPEVQKPPLYYWLIAVTARIRGTAVDAWAVRLPSAVAGALGVLGLYGLMAIRRRPIAGLLAAAMLATALHYTWIARVGRTDIPLTAATLAAVSSIVLARHGFSPYLTVPLGAISIGLGILFKGPLGLVLPGMVVLCWLILRGEAPAPWRLRAWGRLILSLSLLPTMFGVLVLVVPVFLWADYCTGGEFSYMFLWHHNVERGFGGSDLLRAHPWYFYFPRFAVDFLPWSFLVPVAFVAWLRVPGRKADDESQLGLAWLLSLFVLFSLMRFKRADYLLPAYPGAALFLGCWGERLLGQWRRPGQALAGFGASLGVIATIWTVHLSLDLARREPEREYRRFAALVREHAPPPATVVFFRTEAHALAFQVGRPLAVFVEWERLEALASESEPTYVLMPQRVLPEARSVLKRVALDEVVVNTALPDASNHEKPLVLLRSRPPGIFQYFQGEAQGMSSPRQPGDAP